MKIVPMPSRNPLTEDERRAYDPLAQEILEALREYTGNSGVRRCMARGVANYKLPFVLKHCPEDYQQAVVLDLGCGAIAHMDSELVNFEPWLCRALHAAGVDVIGVDIQKTVLRERFRAYTLDLMQEDALTMFPDNSIDVAHASMLFDEPMILHRGGFGAGRRLYNNLLPQLERIVKDDGAFIYDNAFI